MKKSVIIVAGGSGVRMGGDVPKQFLLVKGKPLLMWSIEKFISYDPDIQVVLVLPETWIEEWERLCIQHAFRITCQIAKGGETRFHSVRNGLLLVQKNSVTGIHDAVRPLVSLETISCCFKSAEERGNAIPCIELVDSVREILSQGSRVIPRENLRLIQTPQVFRYRQLKEAYNRDYEDSFTDDASVVEEAGYEIHLVEGNRENIKVTTMMDLRLVGELIGGK